jgi:hypothetical protein
MEESHAKLNETLSNIKNEKKQLKQFAKQTRSELEEMDNLKKEIDILKMDVQQKDEELGTASTLIQKLQRQQQQQQRQELGHISMNTNVGVDEQINKNDGIRQNTSKKVSSIFHFNPNS